MQINNDNYFKRNDNKESHKVVIKHPEKKVSIEHIMPQTLSDKWKEELGADWERIHEQYLHTMANLTLTGYNSQYSNLPFIEKREMEKGFKDSAFRLNIYLRSCNQWTEEELKTRQNALLNVFNVSSTNSEQSKLCINSPLQIDARLLWEQAIGSNGT